MIELLAKDGHTVFFYGQEKYFSNVETNPKIKRCETMKECAMKSSIVISGMPLSKDNVTVYAPFSNKEIQLDELQSCIENKLFIAGVIPDSFLKNDKEILDLNLIESLTILNAIPTVEGVIKIAIEETETTIHEANVMILGYGRIGKILCHHFQMMGANVYCAARKATDLTWIREAKYIPVKYENIEEYCENVNIIVNTVPSHVIGEDIMAKLSSTCLIIDVASKPGGLDKEIAERYKIRVITALGIPGKVAPKTAAKYIKEVIQEKLES